MCGIPKPTPAQLGGFSDTSEGGERIVAYEPPPVLPIYQGLEKYGVSDSLLARDRSKPGQFKTSEGRTLNAREVFETQQKDTYGSVIQGAGNTMNYGHTLVGYNLSDSQSVKPKGNADTSPAPAPTPEAQPAFGSGGGGSLGSDLGGTSSGGGSSGGGVIQKTAQAQKPFESRGSAKRKRKAGGASNRTLVNGGTGVLGTSNTSGKTLLGE